MNTQKFIDALKKRGWSQTDLAQEIGISRTRLSAKIHGRYGASFTQPEISAIKNKLQLSMDEVEEIFFASEVS